jgi:hypothetical protein
MSLKDMPVVTVEQIVRFREASLLVEQQRENAWRELSEIRESIGANPEESTLDEARRVVVQRDKLLAALKDAMRLLKAAGYVLEGTATNRMKVIIAEIEAAQ